MTAMDDSSPFGNVGTDFNDDLDCTEPVSVLESPFVSGQIDTDALFHQLPAAVKDAAKRVEDKLRLTATGQAGSSAGCEPSDTLPDGGSSTASAASTAPQRAYTASVADILESPFASTDVADVMQHISKAEADAEASAKTATA